MNFNMFPIQFIMCLQTKVADSFTVFINLCPKIVKVHYHVIVNKSMQRMLIKWTNQIHLIQFTHELWHVMNVKLPVQNIYIDLITMPQTAQKIKDISWNG